MYTVNKSNTVCERVNILHGIDPDDQSIQLMNSNETKYGDSLP